MANVVQFVVVAEPLQEGHPVTVTNDEVIGDNTEGVNHVFLRDSGNRIWKREEGLVYLQGTIEHGVFRKIYAEEITNIAFVLDVSG